MKPASSYVVRHSSYPIKTVTPALNEQAGSELEKCSTSVPWIKHKRLSLPRKRTVMCHYRKHTMPIQDSIERKITGNTWNVKGGKSL